MVRHVQALRLPEAPLGSTTYIATAVTPAPRPRQLRASRHRSISVCTMQFTEGAYQLAMLTSGCCGSVSPTSGGQLAGKIVTITATPNSGCYSFNGWTGSGSGSYTGSANPAMVTMNGDITETA